MKSRFKRYFKNKWIVAGLAVAVILIVYLFVRSRSNGILESVAVTRGNVIEEVSVIGKALPIGKADLSFQKGGVVKTINVTIGQSVKKGDRIATLDGSSDIAALRIAEAEFRDRSRGLRPEELALNQSVVVTSSTTLASEKRDAVNAARDAYVKIQGAVVNYTDTFFENAQSVSPQIKIRVDATAKENSIELKRLATTDALRNWKTDIDKVSSSDEASYILSRSDQYADIVQSFMSDLSLIVNDLSTGNSALSQSEIDNYTSKMNSGLDALTSAVSIITSATSALKDAESSYAEAINNFELEKAGSSPDAIQAQQAKVSQASAEISKGIILSPLAGIVTKIEPEVGEYVNAGDIVFAVQSNGVFKAEASVTEADIAKISIANRALITLDAYGPDITFGATVVALDPAETVVEGVPTYKVTLHFDQADTRIFSGMTANVKIISHEKDGVLRIPARSVINSGGRKVVRIVEPDNKNYNEVEVTTGLKGSDGMIEVLSGVREGEKVVISIK